MKNILRMRMRTVTHTHTHISMHISPANSRPAAHIDPIVNKSEWLQTTGIL